MGFQHDIHNLSGNTALPDVGGAAGAHISESLPSRTNTGLYCKAELIDHLHRFFIALYQNSATMVLTDAPADELRVAIGTSLGQFFLSNSPLYAQLQETLYSGPSAGENSAHLWERINLLRTHGLENGSAISQVERQNVFALLDTLGSVVNQCGEIFGRIPRTYSNEAREHFGVAPRSNLLSELRKGYERTLMHTGSIGPTDAVLGEQSDFISDDSALRVLSTLSQLSRMKTVGGQDDTRDFLHRKFCADFGLAIETPLDSIQELKDFFNERFRALQPRVLSLLEQMVVAKTRHLLQQSDLYLSSAEFARRVDSEDPFDFINSDPSHFPNWRRVRREVLTQNEYPGGYSQALQRTLSRAFAEWGVEAKQRPCDDFADVINIVRADWPKALNRRSS